MLAILAASMIAVASDGRAAPEPTPTPRASPTLYCITEVLTGSRIPKKVCATRQGWETRGVDILRDTTR